MVAIAVPASEIDVDLPAHLIGAVYSNNHVSISTDRDHGAVAGTGRRSNLRACFANPFSSSPLNVATGRQLCSVNSEMAQICPHKRVAGSRDIERT